MSTREGMTESFLDAWQHIPVELDQAAPKPGDVIQVTYETTVRSSGTWHGHGAMKDPAVRNVTVRVVGSGGVEPLDFSEEAS